MQIEEVVLVEAGSLFNKRLYYSIGVNAMILVNGIGAEIQRPLATVVVGGPNFINSVNFINITYPLCVFF